MTAVPSLSTRSSGRLASLSAASGAAGLPAFFAIGIASDGWWFLIGVALAVVGLVSGIAARRRAASRGERRLALAGALLGGLVVLWFAAYFAITAAAATTSAATPTLTLLDVSGPGVPVGDASQHKEPQPGDQILLTDSLYTWKGGRRGARVGHIDATLTFRSGFSKAGAKVYLVGQLFLPSGSLLVEGFTKVSTGPTTFTLPVVGGTGTYAASRGTMTSHDLGSSGEKSTIVVSLTQS
jgi:hypothetical protein